MPYVSFSNGRYIHAHNCNIHHYGDMSLLRPCCIEDAQKLKGVLVRNALTRRHPVYVAFTDAWNSLTDAERNVVGDIVSNGFYDGFSEAEKGE